MSESDIPLGAHIYSSRLGGTYNHHGIYIGQDQVVQYSGFSTGFCYGPINQVSLEDFLDGNSEFCLREYTQKFTPEEVVERALSRLGEDDYNVFKKNCEHFATWVHTDTEGGQEALGLIEKISGKAILFGKADKRIALAGLALREATYFFKQYRSKSVGVVAERRFQICFDDES